MKKLVDNLQPSSYYYAHMLKSVTVREAEKILDISRQAIIKAIKQGRLKADLFVLGAIKAYRIQMSEVERFKKERESQP